jgi:hypothetical protein
MRRLRTSHEKLSLYRRRARRVSKQGSSETHTLLESLYNLLEADLLVQNLNDEVLSYLIGMAILRGGELLTKEPVASTALATIGRQPASGRLASPPSDAVDERATGALRRVHPVLTKADH